MNRHYVVVFLFAVVLGNVALSMDLASAEEEAENCEDGLKCHAKIGLTQDPSKPPVLSAGFGIFSNASRSKGVGKETKYRIEKDTPFTYKHLAHELLENVEAALKKYNCAMREDLVADALRKSAFAIGRNCEETTSEACKNEIDVLECGNEISVPPIAYPWEAFLGTDKPMDFDKDDSNFDIFYNLLKYTQLDDILTKTTNITLLAPNDGAFARSAGYLTSYKGELDDEKSIYEAYKNASMKVTQIDDVQVDGIDALRFLLAYHVVGGKHPEKAFAGVSKYHLTSATVPVLSVMSELIDLSEDTPNAKILDGDCNIVGDVLIHLVDHVMIPYEIEFEMDNLSQCPIKEPSSSDPQKVLKCPYKPVKMQPGQSSGMAAYKYEGDGPNIPKNWANLDCDKGDYAIFAGCKYCKNECGGKVQSPVDIRLDGTKEVMPWIPSIEINPAEAAKVTYKMSSGGYYLVCDSEMQRTMFYKCIPIRRANTP